MVKVKPIEEVKKKYREGATVAPGRYRDAVARTTGVISASLEAQELFEAKMSDPAVLARRARALEKLSDEDWRRPAIEKGAARIGPGMTAAVDKHATKWSPFRSALEAVSLPPKTVDPMANIDARVKPVVEALVKKKEELLG